MLAQQDKLLAKRGKTRRGAAGSDNGEGMRLEGERRPVFVKAVNDCLMAEVDAVEYADGQTGDTGMRRELRKRFGTGEHGNLWILLAPQA